MSVFNRFDFLFLEIILVTIQHIDVYIMIHFTYSDNQKPVE